MGKELLLKAIKGGMKGELDSIAVYAQAKSRADSNDVKEFFAQRETEEKNHYNYLLRYFEEINEGRPMSSADTIIIKNDLKSPIFTTDFLKRIGSDQQLFSATAVAVLLEMNAIQYYKKCAEDTPEGELKKFFSHMAEWESGHYHDVLKIQEEAEQYFWQENRFEPF